MALGGELVLRLAGEAGGGGVLLGAGAHRDLVEGAEEAVVHHRVDDLLVADAVAGASARQQVGRLGHRLHAAGHDDVGLALLDHLIGQVDGVEPGQAHLVDGGRRHRHRDAAVHRRLAGADLAGAGLEHLAHEDVVDLLAGEAGAHERLLDGEATELRAGEARQGAGQLADRRASASQDHGTSHVFPHVSVGSWRGQRTDGPAQTRPDGARFGMAGSRGRSATTVKRPCSGPTSSHRRALDLFLRSTAPRDGPTDAARQARPLRPALRTRRVRRVLRRRPARPRVPSHGRARPALPVQPRSPRRHQRRGERRRRRRDPDPGARRVPPRRSPAWPSRRPAPTPPASASSPATRRPSAPPAPASRRSPPARACRCSVGGTSRSTTP